MIEARLGPKDWAELCERVQALPYMQEEPGGCTWYGNGPLPTGAIGSYTSLYFVRREVGSIEFIMPPGPLDIYLKPSEGR